MSRWKKALWILVAALVLLVIVALFLLGPVVKLGMESFGPRMAGVPISVEQVRLQPLTGRLFLKGFVVGNPEGFQTPHAFQMAQLEIRLRMLSLLSRTLIIERIYVNTPEVVYEIGLRGSNLGRLSENMAGPQTAPESEQSTSAKRRESGKKVVIRDLLIESPRVRLSVTAAGGQSVPIPLPTIHLEHIGEEEGGVSMRQALGTILNAIGKAAQEAVGAGGRLVTESGKALGAGAQDAGETVVKGAAEAVEGVKKLFKGDGR